MTPCDRENHATREEAWACVRQRCAERAARRSANWQRQFDALLLLYADPSTDDDVDQTVELLTPEERATFVETLASDENFRAAVAAWVGGAA